jgi:opacity protein-like surface antigen
MVHHMKCSRVAFLSFVFAVVGASAAHAQLDLSASGFEAFNGSSAGNGTKETLTNGTGGMVEARYFLKQLLGFGASFSYDHESLTLAPNGTSCDYTCANPTTKLSAKAEEIAFDWVPSMKLGKARAFAVGGAAIFLTMPGPSVPEVSAAVRAAYVFGGGVDIPMVSHLGLRLQYRANLYKAPNPYPLYPATGNYITSSEPMGGLYYRF